MDKKLLEMLVNLEMGKLIQGGMSVDKAIEQAAKNVKDAMDKADFEAHCGCHDC